MNENNNHSATSAFTGRSNRQSRRGNHTNENKKTTSVVGFIGRFAVAHTVAYFIAGLVFSALLNYQEIFATSAFSHMRPFEHPLVILGATLQLFRGAFLALAFLPFRHVIIERKRGWVYIFVALWILMNVGADSAEPGKIEGFIYADYPLADHLFSFPEFTCSTLLSAWLFHTWERNPKDKRLSIPLIGAVVVIIAFAVLGLLFMPPT
jgi:hypothetical protein